MSKEYIFSEDELKLSDKLYTEFYENALNITHNSKQILHVKIKDKENELNDLYDMINDSSSSSSEEKDKVEKDKGEKDKEDIKEELLKFEIAELVAEL